MACHTPPLEKARNPLVLGVVAALAIIMLISHHGKFKISLAIPKQRMLLHSLMLIWLYQFSSPLSRSDGSLFGSQTCMWVFCYNLRCTILLHCEVHTANVIVCRLKYCISQLLI